MVRFPPNSVFGGNQSLTLYIFDGAVFALHRHPAQFMWADAAGRGQRRRVAAAGLACCVRPGVPATACHIMHQSIL